MAWCRPDDKPLSEPVTFSLLTHIDVNRPQMINTVDNLFWGGKKFDSLSNCTFLGKVMPIELNLLGSRENFIGLKH